MAYTPNAFDSTRPIDTDIAETAQLEFRTMKAFYHGTVGRTAAFTSVNTAVGVNILNISIPAGILGSNKKVTGLITGYFSNATGGAQSTTINISYGATVIATFVINAPTNGNFAFKIEIDLHNTTATNAQGCFVELTTFATDSHTGFQASSGTSGIMGASAEDSTAAKNLTVTSQMSAASPNLAVVITSSFVEWHN